METITVFKETYDSAIKNEFEYMTELAKLKGTIIALADIIKTNPSYVEDTLSKLSTEFKGDK